MRLVCVLMIHVIYTKEQTRGSTNKWAVTARLMFNTGVCNGVISFPRFPSRRVEIKIYQPTVSSVGKRGAELAHVPNSHVSPFSSRHHVLFLDDIIIALKRTLDTSVSTSSSQKLLLLFLLVTMSCFPIAHSFHSNEPLLRLHHLREIFFTSFLSPCYVFQ